MGSLRSLASFIFHSSGKVFHWMMEHDSWELFPFRLKSISKVRHGCWANGVWLQLLFQFIPKVFSRVQAWALCGTVNHVYGQWVVCIFYYGNSLNLISQSVYQNKTFTKEIVFVYRDVLWPLTDILKCQRVLQVNTLSNGFDWPKSFLGIPGLNSK